MHWPLYVALAALALGAALAGLRESAAVPWFMVAVGLVASVFGLGAGLAALGLASLLLFFQGAMNPSSLAALLLAALLAHQVGESLRRAHRRAKYLAQTHRLLAEALEALPGAKALVANPEDLPHLEALARERGVELQAEPALRLGVRAVGAEGKTQVENSLLARLDRAWDALSSKVAQALWG